MKIAYRLFAMSAALAASAPAQPTAPPARPATAAPAAPGARVATAPAPPYVDKVHREAATSALADGWHRAHSTQGHFSVDLPAPFRDATAVNKASVGMLLRAVDGAGRIFIAVREPTMPNGPMANSFEEAINNEDAKPVQFMGVPAMDERIVQGAMVMHSMTFRTATGTYLLGVAVPAEREQESAALRQRFLASFALD